MSILYGVAMIENKTSATEPEPMRLVVIEGTVRPRRESIKVSHYIVDIASRQPGVEVVFVDPVDFIIPGDGNDPEGRDPRYTAIVESADAFFIVVPEYNHSFPGSLKRLLDSEFEAYLHKPVAFAGVSNSAWGGTRGVEALATAVRELGLVVMSWDIFFPRVQDIFNGTGQIKSEYAQQYERNVQQLLDELLWFARLLGRARLDVV